MDEKVKPQAPNEGRQYVYNKLKEKGYNVGEYSDFDTAMSNDEDSRRWAYDELGKSGIDLGGYDQFESGIGYVKPTEVNGQKASKQKHSIQEATAPKLEFPKLDKNLRMVDGHSSTPLLKTEQYLEQVGTYEDGTPAYETKQRAALVPDFDPQNGGVTAPPAYLDVRTGKTIKATDKRPEVQRAKDEAKRKPEQITNVGRATRDSLASLDADIDKQMSQAIERVTKDYVDKAKDPKHLWAMAISSGPLVPGGAGMAGGATTFDPNNDTEVATLKEAKRRLNDARNIIAEADHNAQSGTLGKWLESSFAGGAARGFGQKLFDARTWDFGLRDLAGNLMVKSALDKADAGKSLTKAEMMLLDAISVEMATNAYFGSYVGHGYKAGGVTAEAIPFMLEFVMNPLSSTGSSATNKLARYAIKRYGLKVAKGAGQKALRVGGRVLGDVAGAAGMTMTTGAVRTAADVVDRTTGDVHFGLNDNDRIVYDGHEKGEDLGTAIYKGVASRTIENYSEMFGNYLGPLLGGAGRIVSKGASKVPYLRRATEFIGKVNGSQFGRMVDDLMTKTQWQGAPAEYAEEVAGNVMNALLVGDKDFSTDKGKGVFNLDDNIDTFLGVSLMSGAISMAKTAGYRTPTMEARKSVERSDNKALSAFGDPVRWGDIRSAIDTGIDKEIHNAVAGVLRDKEATEGQKKAVLDYAKRSQEYRGMIEAKRNKLTESGDDATAEDMQTSYENGYTLSTPQQMADAKNNLDYLAYKASSDLGIAKNELSELSEGNIDGSYVQGLRDRGYTDKQIGSVLDWLNAKATYDGLIQNAKGSIADTIQDIHDDIDANTAKDGTLRVATIKDGEGGDKQVYIVDGNVSMLEDGSGVDKANSDDNIIVRDPETGEVKFIHLSSVISAEEAKDPEVEKARLSDEAKQSIAGLFANQIEGKLPLAVGDVYSFATEAGEPYQVSILQDNGDGTMQVEANGAQVQMSREDLQAQADITNQVRVRQYHDEEAQKQEELKNLERAEEGKPTYHLNDQIVVRTPEGVDTVGYIQAEEDEDGRIEVWTDSPINGRRVQLFSRDELDGMLVQHNPAENSSDAETTEEAITEEDEDMDVAQEPEGEELEPEQVTEGEGVAPEHDIEDNTALVGIPLDENGEPAYESVPVSTSYDALMEQTDGDADMVDRVIDSVLSDKRAELKKVEASKVKHGGSVTEKIRAEREREALLEKARGDVAYWEQMKGEREERRIKELQNIDETARVEIGEAPEYHMDNGEDARERGYVNVSGYRIDRQEPISNALFGKEHNVKFATDVAPDAKYAVIDVRELQASHNSGMQNARHFIPEAQPKDRSGSVSVMRSESMARHIKPEEITGGATAYAGAPVVNSRGEVIQGNGRSDALRLMWLHNPDVSEGYKQYLVDHADKFGLDADAIRSMHAPVLVHMVDVDDSEAIRLGQYKMGDIETGGEERIDPAVTAQKMGGDIGVYASLLFASSEEGKSLSDLVSRNGVDVLQWMNRKGYISDNQYSSALNKQGALTTEAREDLKAILYQILFDGRHISIKKDFDDLPKSAQNALLQTVHRAIGLPENSEIIELLQKSIGAYAGLLQYDTFREAKTPEEVAMAIDNWSGMQDLFSDKSNGEIFGNFALKLAEEMRVSTQRKLASLLNELYDVVQGAGEDTLFEASETTPKSLQEAVIQVFGLEDGNNGIVAVADEGSRSESGGHGRPREATSGEPTEVEEGEAQRRGGIDEHSEEVAPESVDTQASDTTGGGYRLSAIAAKRGGNFFENNEGSIDLVKISDNVFEAIGIKPLPMRMTEAMAQHIIKQHAKELGISTQEEAVAFVVDIMQHFDHVREGKKPKTYIFSIEKGRSRTGKRAVTLVLPSKSGEYLGVSSSGYEKVSRLKERALLWEEGANNEAPTTETASVNVTSPSATQGGMTGGSASNQSNALSEGKDSEKNTTEEDSDIRYRYTEREDGTLLSDNALEAEEHGKFPKAKFRKVYGLTPTDFEMMLAIGLIVNSEWHHTGKTFRETKYYSWADNAELDNGFFGRESTLKDGDIYYNMDGRATTENPFYISEEEANTLPLAESALSEWYKAHKKEIKKLADEYKRREWAWETLENVPSVKYDNVDYLKSFIWRRYDPNDYNRDVIGLLSEILSDSMIFDEKKKRQGGDIPRERINAIYDEAYKEAKDIVQEGPDANHDDMYKRILDNHLEERDYAELINAERMKRNLSEDSKAGILLQLAGLANLDRKQAIYSIGNFVKYDVLGKHPNYNGYVYRSSSLNDVGNGEVSNSLVRELQFIKDKARADGSFMKAPNGRPTNLTEKQWLQVRTTAFKEWFGDWENDPANASKVVDENGEPMVVYHGTSVSRRRFFKFKDGAPNWFTPSEYYAKAFTLDENIPVMYPSFINIKKILPLGYIDGDVISGKIRSLSLDTGISESSIKYIASKERADKVYQITNSPLFKKEAMALGYDGVTAFEGGVDSFAVFSPSQVKSATENTGSFDGTNDDIRYNSYDVVDKDEYDMQALERVATSMSESLGESTHIVHDTEEIEGRNERETNRMRGAKGWYDFKTGQVVVVLPNHTDEADVARTVLHEIVGHKGIRAVVGDSSFEAFLDKVYKGATTDVRKAIIDRSKQYGWNVRLSTEEYIAELAERGFADREGQGMWNKVKVLFRDMISHVKMLLGFDIGDRELRYMLWRSWQMQHKSGIMAEAENISMQMELGVGNFSSEGNARYRRGTHVPPTEGDGSLKEEYDNLIASSRYQMAEAIQDSMKSVSEVYKMILEKEGKPSDIEDVDGYENAYLGENRLSSVNQAEMEYFSHQVFKPFLDEVGNIVKDGSSYEEVTDYMMSLHGLERNRSMAFDRAVKSLAKEQGDTTLEDRIHREYLEDSDRIANEEAFEARRISADEYHKEDDRIRKSYAGEVYDEYRRVDYAGLTGMDSVYEGVEDAESDALELIREFEDMHDVIKLWSTKRGVTDATRMKLYDTGLISKETEAKLRDMYKYYIPLRGFADGTSEDHYGYLGESMGSFSPAIKKAKGRKSQADDPIAQMSKMFESAVVQGNRNKLVKQKMLNFVTNHPTELFSVSDLWLRYNDVTEEWEPVFPEPMPDGASHEEVEERMRAFEEKMMQAKKDNPSEYKRGAEARNIPYRVLERELNEHQMIVKRGGRSIVVTINGNPRFAQAINGMSNPDSNVGGWVGAIFELGSKVNRVLSALYTTKNPDFLVSNMIRDMLYSNTMVWVKESPSYARRFHANIAKYNPAVLRGLIKKHKAGTLNLEDETERHFYQFMMNGGETGYTQQRDIEGHKNEIQRALIGSSGRLTAKKAFMLLEKLGDDINRAVENVARFSAYVASRDEGRSIDRSIYDAKEISVNFNKKGAGSKFYNAYGQTFWGKSGALISGAGRSFYVFWNAAVQGLSNYGRYVGKNPNKGMVHAASFFTLGVVIPLMAYMNGSGDGDDDYWDLPEYVRRSNICFNAGDGTWVTIPLPQEMRAVYGLGELATSTISGKEHMDDMELGKAMVEQMTQVLPLDLMEGGGSLRALYPSFVKPLVEASDNVSWTGSPIYKDTPYNKSDPEWTKAYRTANSSLVWLSKTLNELTGGDDYKSGMVDFNPAQVEYILKGYFGGAWSFTNKLVKSGEIMVGSRDFEWGSIPLANRVVKTSDERTKFRNTNNEYYKYKKEAEEVKRLERKYEKSDNVLDYAKKIDELQRDIQYRRYLTFEDLNAEVELLQKALKEEDDPRKVEELTQALREAKKSLVDSIRNIK